VETEVARFGVLQRDQRSEEPAPRPESRQGPYSQEVLHIKQDPHPPDGPGSLLRLGDSGT